MLYLKLLFIAYLAYASLSLYFGDDTWLFIQNVNLIFHEAGHALTMFFGRFLNIFGGTLFEFGIPLLITLYFILKQKYFSAGFGAWWLSTAFFSISVYAADARTQLLPLLGGDNVGHDWFNILSMLNILRYDQQISDLFIVLSILSLILAVFYFNKDVRPILKSKLSI